MKNKYKIIILSGAVLALIISSVTFAAWYNPVDWFKAVAGVFHKGTNLNDLHPRMYKTTGKVGIGETLPRPGVYGSFIYVTYNYICGPDCPSKSVTVNLFDLKNSNLVEGDKVVVYYNPNNTEDIVVYNLKNELIYKTGTTGKLSTTTPKVIEPTISTSTVALKTAMEIILDASGSMASKLAGEQKIDIAKKAIENVINDSFDAAVIGLRVYGSEGKYEDKNCKDTRLLFPIKKLDKPAYISSIKNFSPSGWTPIDYVLRLSKADFDAYVNNPKKIVLVSDGEETCGGDPCQAIKALKAQGFNVVVDTIGFDVDLKAKEQLKCIATASGGTYYDAINIGQLEKILRIIVPKVPLPEKIIIPRIAPPEPIRF